MLLLLSRQYLPWALSRKLEKSGIQRPHQQDGVLPTWTFPLSLSPGYVASHSSAVFVFFCSLPAHFFKWNNYWVVHMRRQTLETYWAHQGSQRNRIIGYSYNIFRYRYIVDTYMRVYPCQSIYLSICLYSWLLNMIENVRSTDPCTVENPCITLHLALCIQGSTLNWLQIV